MVVNNASSQSQRWFFNINYSIGLWIVSIMLVTTATPSARSAHFWVFFSLLLLFVCFICLYTKPLNELPFSLSRAEKVTRPFGQVITDKYVWSCLWYTNKTIKIYTIISIWRSKHSTAEREWSRKWHFSHYKLKLT